MISLRRPVAATGVLLAIVAAVASLGSAAAASLERAAVPEVPSLPGLFGSLLFAAVLVERATEVFASWIRARSR